MKRSLLLMLVIATVSSCKTRDKKSSNRSKSLVSDDLRLSFDPRRPRVGEEFTVQIEVLRDGKVVTDGAGSEVTVQLSHRCGSNKNYSRAQLAEADDGVAEIELTIGTRRGQAMTCAFRAVANDVTREKFSFKLKAGDNYGQHDPRHNNRPLVADDNCRLPDHRSGDRHRHGNQHRHNDRCADRHNDRHNDRHDDRHARNRRCGHYDSDQRHRGHQRHREHQQVTISRPVTAIDRGRVTGGKEFTVNSSREIDIELVDCGRAQLFRYQPQRQLEEADCHTISSGETKMFIVGKVKNGECDFAIDGRKIDFDAFSSFHRGHQPCLSVSLLEPHDVAFREDKRRWQVIRQDEISRRGNDWDDEILVRVDGWWCRLDD